jgi:hypothetical protein
VSPVPYPCRPAPVRAVLAGVTAAVLLGGCGVVIGGDDAVPPPQPEVVAPSDAPVPVPSEPRLGAQGVVNSLTGEGVPDGPVLAVKVDNTTASLPQVGINQADLVYVEEVEGGATRLLVVFQTEVPDRVGPVRSGRSTDVNLLGNFGPVVLAYAGATRGVRAELAETELQLVSLTAGDAGFSRAPGRPAPYDVIGDGRVLLSQAPGAGVARDIGLRFGPVPDGGRPTARASYSWPASTAEFAWSGDDDAWVQLRDGAVQVDDAGEPVRAANVVFMDVDVVPTRYVDVNGARSPEVRPIGSGAVTLLRDAQAFPGTWERAELASPTRFLDGGGADLLLDPGTTWFVLMRRDGSPALVGG